MVSYIEFMRLKSALNFLLPHSAQESINIIDVLTTYLLLLIIMLLVFSLLFSATRRRGPMILRTLRTVTVLQCERCDYKEEREFQVGDYVFKKVGECVKCKGPLYISMIYGLPEKTTSSPY
ncbi:MAG: hypothetical protein QW102_03015 [Candidatus Nezhaarchaeales archaeon]